MALVSVVVATYNSSNTLRYTLKSIAAQDFREFEVWVIGDSCTDDSEAVVKDLGDDRFHWFNREQNSGTQSRPNNEGIKRARGKYIAYLGHDDLWFPWHLSALVECIEREKVDFVHSLAALLAPQGLLKMIGPPRPGLAYYHHGFPPSSWLHRKDIVEKYGGWKDPDGLKNGVDGEFRRTMCRAGIKICCCSRLGVLKFPSHYWSLYNPTHDYPQVSYSAALEKDPRQLQEQVLFSAAMKLCENVQEEIRFSQYIRALAKRFIRAYGDYWPLHQVLCWRFKRIRQRLLRDRGL